MFAHNKRQTFLFSKRNSRYVSFPKKFLNASLLDQWVFGFSNKNYLENILNLCTTLSLRFIYKRLEAKYAFSVYLKGKPENITFPKKETYASVACQKKVRNFTLKGK